MARNRCVRKNRGTSWTTETSLCANKVRWDAERARRSLEDPERLAELVRYPPRLEGDPIGVLEWRDLRSGVVKRWTVLMGDRKDRVMLRAPDGRTTGSHGWAWVCDRLRGYLSGRRGG